MLGHVAAFVGEAWQKGKSVEARFALVAHVLSGLQIAAALFALNFWHELPTQPLSTLLHISAVHDCELKVVAQPLIVEHDVHVPPVHAEHSPLHRWSQHTLVVGDVLTQKPERQSLSIEQAFPFSNTQRPLVLHTLFVAHVCGDVMHTLDAVSDPDDAVPA